MLVRNATNSLLRNPHSLDEAQSQQDDDLREVKQKQYAVEVGLEYVNGGLREQRNALSDVRNELYKTQTLCLHLAEQIKSMQAQIDTLRSENAQLKSESTQLNERVGKLDGGNHTKEQ